MDTKHFKAVELACRCCSSYVPNTALLMVLEHVREHFNVPVNINCSTRCSLHNNEVGGALNSWHLSGHAADITVKGVDPSKVYKYLDERGYSDLLGLSCYSTFVHVDTRGKRARW